MTQDQTSEQPADTVAADAAPAEAIQATPDAGARVAELEAELAKLKNEVDRKSVV